MFHFFGKKKSGKLRIKEESKSDFIQDKEYVVSFLKSKGVKEKFYYDLIENNDFGFLEDNLLYGKDLVFFDSNGKAEGYTVEAFYSHSKKHSYLDIVEINQHLITVAKTNIEKFGPVFEISENDLRSMIIIASVGDDGVIYLNKDTGEICLWFTELSEWPKQHIANSVKEFVDMIKYDD